jgi:hypothetical protein
VTRVAGTLDYVLKLAGLPPALRRYLRRTMTADEAGRIVADRLRRRSEIFVEVVERCVHGLPASPYRALLDHAGCELGDLREMVAPTCTASAATASWWVKASRCAHAPRGAPSRSGPRPAS